MKTLFVISLNDSQGRMQSYGISASTRNAAENEARRLAGVDSDAEIETFQKLHPIHSTVD